MSRNAIPNPSDNKNKIKKENNKKLAKQKFIGSLIFGSAALAGLKSTKNFSVLANIKNAVLGGIKGAIIGWSLLKGGKAANNWIKERFPQLMDNLIEKLLVGTGRALLKNAQAVKQLILEINKELGTIDPETVSEYTDKIKEEKDLYDKTAIGKSIAAKLAGFLIDTGLAVAVPIAAGAKGKKLVYNSALAGAILEGLLQSEDGKLSNRVKNAAKGAVEGAVGGYAFKKTATGIN